VRHINLLRWFATLLVEPNARKKEPGSGENDQPNLKVFGIRRVKDREVAPPVGHRVGPPRPVPPSPGPSLLPGSQQTASGELGIPRLGLRSETPLAASSAPLEAERRHGRDCSSPGALQLVRSRLLCTEAQDRPSTARPRLSTARALSQYKNTAVFMYRTWVICSVLE
jgi:hypothetical protein